MGAGEGSSDEFGPGFTGGDYFFWEPVRWNKAVCCMPEMSCWNGDFANKAGREQLLGDLARFQGEYDSAKAEYDVLNEENLIRQQDERSAQLAEGRDYSNKITNRISDNEKRLEKANAALADLTESEDAESPFMVKKAEITTLTKTIKDLKDEKALGDAEFAELDQTDAQMTVNRLNRQINSKKAEIAALNDELQFDDDYVVEMTAIINNAESAETDVVNAQEAI
jgi:hypothetical protein